MRGIVTINGAGIHTIGATATIATTTLTINGTVTINGNGDHTIGGTGSTKVILNGAETVMRGIVTINGNGIHTIGGTINTTAVNINGLSRVVESYYPVTLSSNAATVAWTSGSTLFISTAPTANFSITISGAPTQQVNLCSTTTIIYANGTGNFYCNSFTFNSVNYSGSTLFFTGGNAAISLANNSYVIQSISILYAATNLAISNVSGLKA